MPLLAVISLIAMPFLAAAYTAPTGTPSIYMVGVKDVTSTSAVVQLSFSQNNATYTWGQEPEMTVRYTSLTTGQVFITQQQGVLMGNRLMSFQITNLQPNASYSYVGLMQYNGMTWNTNMGNFITLSATVASSGTTTSTSSSSGNSNTVVSIPTPTVVNLDPAFKSIGNFFSNVKQDAQNAVVTGGATTKNGVTLSITNAAARVNQGDVVEYKVEYLNTNKKDLQNGSLVIALPPQYAFQESSFSAATNANDNTVTFAVGRIPAGTTKTISFTVKAIGDGSGTLSTMATLSYRGGSVSATDHDSYQGNTQSVLGASVFGAGFFPQTFTGWLLIVLLLGLIVYIARRYVKAKEMTQKTA